MYALHFHAYLLHYLHAVHERKHDTLLCSTHYMLATVYIEVDIMHRTSDLTVLQHSFSTVTERQYRDSLTTHRYLCRHRIHIVVADTLRCDITFNPGVEYAGAVDTSHNADTGGLTGVVDMREIIDTRQRIIVCGAIDAIHYP